MVAPFLRFCLCLFFCCAGTANAQRVDVSREPQASLHYYFDTIDQERGLPHADVLTALQTRDGYLWVGTGGGLARYDGVRFVSFRLSNTPAFINHLIHCLYEDREGSLWIGTERGFIRYRNGLFEHLGLEEIGVRAITQDNTGRLWLGTHGQGLYTFENNRLQYVDTRSAIPSPFISALLADSVGRVWIGSRDNRGVACYVNGRLEHLDGNQKISGEIQAMAETPGGVLWFGSRRDGLFRFKAGEVSHFSTSDGLTGNLVSDLKVARDGGLWIVSRTVQKVVDLERFTVASVSQSLSDNPRIVCEDHEGGTWICGRSAGLIHARQMPYRSISTDNGLPENGIKSVTRDKKGNLWLSIQDIGVARVAPGGKVEVLTERDGLPNHHPGPVFAASDGCMWIGFAEGLYALRDGHGTLYRDFPAVNTLFEGHDGTLWVGTNHRGIFRWKDGAFSPVKTGPGRTPPYVSSFSEGRDGTLYVGTWADGLIRLRDGKATLFNRQNGLPSNEVRAIHVDKAGRVWVGLRSRGLAVLQDERWLNPDLLAEAVADQVNAIAEDDQGQLWLGTPNGVMWAPLQELFAAALGAGPVPKLHVAEISDSSPAAAVRAGGQPVVWQAETHELFFATRQGVFVVNPEHLPLGSAAPPVHVENIIADHRTSNAGGPFTAPAGTQEIVIDYTALSFVQPNRILFKYKLDNYDSDWIEAGTRRTAFYAHLAPKTYTFRVKACNSDGVWNETGAVAMFTVAPFFWQTWWFLAGTVAVGASAMVAAVRYVSFRRLRQRLRELAQQAALDRERARIARDIHDDIGNRLTKITLLSGLALRDRSEAEKTSAHVKQIASTVRQVTDSLDEIVWAVNPRNDTLPHLINYVGQFAVEFLNDAGIRLRIELPDHPPHSVVSAETRHNLFLVVKEALNNIVRHAQASDVTVQITLGDTTVRLVVADNGCGFANAPDDGRADGLRNMRQRTTEIGGEFQLESSPGAGTRLSLAFPWQQDGANGASGQS